VIEQFFLEYWIFVEALLEHASRLLGVGVLNEHAARLGYPFGAALALSAGGVAAALGCLRAGRPGWGLAGLAVAEELSALSFASAAFAQGLGIHGGIVIARAAALAVGVVLLCAILRRSLRLARERAPAAPRTPPAW
jgi:hypothetical protein